MKTTKILAIMVLVLGLMVCPAELAGAAPIGTGFTYQGRLVDDNSVANGQYDFQFKVFDNVIFGKQQGNTIYINKLDVIDGYFTAELDFGSGIFTGDARWLEIGVRPGGSTGSFTILSPLQEIRPTPNAMYAAVSDWTNLKNIPADFADGIDNVGSGDITGVTAGDGLTGGGTSGVVTLMHSDTSSQSSVNNLNGVVLQDLILDGYGHVTSLSSYNLDNRYFTESELASSGGGEVHWGSLSNIPAGFADGVDNIGETDSDWTISGNNMYSGVAGNIGIGTSSPLAKLSVGGNGYADTGVYGSGAMYGVYGSGSTVGVHGNGNTGVVGTGTAYGVIGVDRDTGSCGHLGNDIYGVYGNGTYGGYFVSEAESDKAYGGQFIANSGGSHGYGISIDADNTQATGGLSYGIQLTSDCANGTAYGVFSDARVGSGSTSTLWGIYSLCKHVGTAGTSYGMCSEVYGSDTGDSYGVLGVANKDGSDTAGTAYGGYFTGDNNYMAGNSYGVYASATGVGGTNYGIYAMASSGTTNYAGYFEGSVYIKGRTTVRGRLRIEDYSSGETVMELGAGLDYAEGFNVSESTKIGAGSVLIIDADNPGKLAISDKAYDSKVAGIAAGAKGMGSGVRLGSDEFDCDVALAGRVYCNVDATEAPVEPGDLLTTSTTPGYAMKAADYARAQGAILGKAMEKLEKGKKGQILVLVTLQ